MATPALATITPSAPSPADDATGLVPRDTTTFSLLVSSDTFSFYNGTIICVNTGQTLTLTSEAANATATFTFSAPLAVQTTYQMWVNVSDNVTDASAWSNTSYNFTTGRAQLLSDTPNLVIVKLIVGLTTIFVALALVYFTVTNFMHGKRGVKETMDMFKTLFIGLIFLGIVAAITIMF